MSLEFDVAVVGAGIVGASCAAECALSGLKVAIIDAGPIGGGATATNMGQVLVEDGSDAEFLLTKYSVRRWYALRQELPSAVEFDRVGTVWVASNEEEMRVLEKQRRSYARRNVAASLLDRESLAAMEPNLRTGLAGGMLTPDDVVIDASPACRFMVERAQANGARLYLGRPATGLTNSSVRLAGGSSLTAQTIVNAAGVASPTLSPGVPVRPRKGQIAVTDRYPGWVHHQLVEMGYVERAMSAAPDSISFNLQPRRSGQLLIGSSRQLGVTDPKVDPVNLRSMLDRAAEFAPGLARLTILRSLAGFRPATPDHLPLIGPWPIQDGVYLATGHDGLGVTMALGTGRLIADLLAGRPTEIPIGPYLPSRLGKGGQRS